MAVWFRHAVVTVGVALRPLVHEYALDMFGGHPLIRHDRQALLLATGSPVSVGSRTPCRFLGQEFPVQPQYNGLTAEQLSEHVGTRIDVLLGADVLARFAVTIDAETSRVVFGDERGVPRGRGVPLETIGGIPVVEVGLAGRTLRTLFHTGATVSCLQHADTRPYPFVGVARDFYPGMGEFATELRRVPLTFGDQTVNLVCGVLPPTLARALLLGGVHGIVGTNLLQSYKVGWAPGFGELRLQARPAPVVRLTAPQQVRRQVLPAR
ncbi:MAG TPA: hypothetical protein VGQ25_08640 [Gemmatimonadales bacterium]|jgi:hypothetical protein|nr:hypothetical protein [Gemmatimonadales bacterium]